MNMTTGRPLQGPQFQQTAPVEFCLNCQSNYKDTPESRPRHQAPCTRCGSDGHAACQH